MTCRAISSDSTIRWARTYWVVGVDPLGRNEHSLFFHPCGCGSLTISSVRAGIEDSSLRELRQLEAHLGVTNPLRLVWIALVKCGVAARLQSSTRFRDSNKDTTTVELPSRKHRDS